MKAKIIFGGSLLVVLLTQTLMINSNVLAGGTQKMGATASSAGASVYLIEVSHTPEECLNALDEVKAEGANKLNQWNWGCKYGNHTGYLMVKAANETEALSNVPAAERDKAKVLPLGKFTVEEIAAFHKQMGK
jgi:hypothetical protein